MDKSILNNKMIVLDQESKIKFNMDIHGFRKDQVVNYNSLPNDKKVLVRRRFSDNDGCVEVVVPEIKTEVKKEVPSEPSNSKPKNGKQGSNTKNKENS